MTETPPHADPADQATHLLAAGLSIVAGACVAAQGKVNGTLSELTGQPLQASTFSMSSGFALLCLALLVPGFRAGLRREIAAVREGRVRWWHLLTGALGSAMLAVQAWAVPQVGVAMFTVALVAGQSASGLGVDRLGLGPGGVRPVRPARALAAGLAVLGVGLAMSGRGSLTLALWPVLATLLVGATTMVQQAWNAKTAAHARSLFASTYTNFGVGAAVLLALLAGRAALGHPPASLAGAPWWILTGGALGIVFISVGAWASRHVGVLVFGVMSLLGNLGTAVVLDLLSAHRHALGPLAVAGIALTFVAAVLAAVAARPRRHPRDETAGLSA